MYFLPIHSVFYTIQKFQIFYLFILHFTQFENNYTKV